jgi:hypothetical protein
MSKLTKILLGSGAVAVLTLLLGAACADGCCCGQNAKLLPAEQAEQALQVLLEAREILTLVGQACETPEHATMVAEILLVAAAKESGGTIDGQAELEQALTGIEDPGLRTFTHFLAAISAAMVEHDHAGAAEHLQAVIAESQKRQE